MQHVCRTVIITQWTSVLKCVKQRQGLISNALINVLLWFFTYLQSVSNALMKCTTWNVSTQCLIFQRRTKQKVVTDFATLSKGTSAGAKPRAALRQVLFSQGVSDKSPAAEVLCCLLLITLHADMCRNTYRLAQTGFHPLKQLKQPQQFCSALLAIN